jgi:Mitovirus RNA-dependent RNA polymerase
MLPPLRKVPSLAKGHATTRRQSQAGKSEGDKARGQEAEQCYPGQVFRRYAILGDDIADDRVAMTYSALLERLGVSISLPKSLTSKEGACEFAVLSLPVGSRSLLFPISG